MPVSNHVFSEGPHDFEAMSCRVVVRTVFFASVRVFCIKGCCE